LRVLITEMSPTGVWRAESARKCAGARQFSDRFALLITEISQNVAFEGPRGLQNDV
jgi:hypothetical protein